MIRPLLAPLFLSTALTAQQATTTAYVQTSVGGGFGNSVPFGCLTNGLFVEGRSQILILPQFLPGPFANLTGIAVHSQTSAGGSGTLVYPLLKITVSPTRATNLNADFASNLTAPLVVLNATNLPIQWVANSWVTIPFSIPYVHDGTSGLVIEIQKVVSPTLDLNSRTIQNAGRADLPAMINALGGAGSNAHLAATATVTTNYPLSMVLRWTTGNAQGVPTLKLRSDGASTYANQFALGRNLTHTVQAVPGQLVFDLVAPDLQLPRSGTPLLEGRLWLHNQFPLGQGIVPSTGERTTTVLIPNDTALIGAHLAFQSIVVATAAPPFKVTNSADCYIRS